MKYYHMYPILFPQILRGFMLENKVSCYAEFLSEHVKV